MYGNWTRKEERDGKDAIIEKGEWNLEKGFGFREGGLKAGIEDRR